MILKLVNIGLFCEQFTGY